MFIQSGGFIINTDKIVSVHIKVSPNGEVFTLVFSHDTGTTNITGTKLELESEFAKISKLLLSNWNKLTKVL